MRLDELFPYPAERTEFSDAFYAALGRAVAFCTLFEANCRALGSLLGIRARAASEPSIQDMLDDVVRELQKRRLVHHLDAIVTRLGLASGVRETFRIAREARNILAHEFAVGVERDVETDLGRTHRLAELERLVRQVASADVLVCLLGQFISKEDLPSAAFVDSYPARVSLWVCDVDS